jgi:NADPH:quinone reductase-like Zn-dependent oxidoreductase
MVREQRYFYQTAKQPQFEQTQSNNQPTSTLSCLNPNTMSSTSLPSDMRALLHNQKTKSLSLASVPLPTPSASQYLIKPHAVAFTQGELLWPRPEELITSSPGVEFAARVVQSPSPSAKFQPGDEVYARVTYPQPGGAREYSLSDDSELALRPKNFSISEAVSMPVSALTAWQGLFEEFKLPALGSTASDATATRLRILVTAASGNVGIWVVQLAKLLGAYVIGTAGGPNVDFVRSLGADEVLDYKTTNIRTWVEEDPSRKVDFVLDAAGGASLQQAWYAVKDGGEVRTIVPPADMQWKWVIDRPEGVSESVVGTFFRMHPSGEQLGKITELAEQGKVRAVVDSVWKFDEYQKAFERLASGRTKGKVVLKVDDEE